MLIYILICINGEAQLSGGGNISCVWMPQSKGKLGELGDLTTVGLGINSDFQVRKKVNIYAGFNYYLPIRHVHYLTATPKNNLSSLSNKLVANNSRISTSHVYSGIRGYFAGDNNSEVALYGLADLGGWFVSGRSKVDDFDRETLHLDHSELKYRTIILTGAGGVGLERNLKTFKFFLETRVNFALIGKRNEYNGVPPSIDFNVGVRFPIKIKKKEEEEEEKGEE